MADSSSINRQIKGEIYDSLRNSLIAPIGKTKKSWTDNFIQEMLKAAKNKPEGPLGQLIAKQLMQDDILSSLDEQTEKLLMRDRDFLEYRIFKQCFKEQRDVLLDTTSKYIIINTGRRSGKSSCASKWLVKKCIIPNSPTFYIHLKFENAIRQCFDQCLQTAKDIELPIDHYSKNEGMIVFSNGSTIKFAGNNNKAEADKLRGYKARGIVIDEAAFGINMNYLINDVLTPIMADYTDSQMILCSTPPRIPKTFYEDAYRSGAWTVYEWYANKNPFIPSFDAFIEELCEKKKLTKDSPFIQREGYGQMVYDSEAQVFKDYKTYTEIPPSFTPTHVYIGNDYGWNDYNAIIGVATNNQKKIGYVFYERKFNKSTVTDIVNANKEAVDRARQLLIKANADLSNIAIYGDTSDKSIIYEMVQTHNLPAYCCYKYDKANAITQLADYCRNGSLYVPQDGILDDEFQRTLYKRNEDDTITGEIDDELFHPDAIFALLYASRQFHFDWSGTQEEEE